MALSSRPSAIFCLAVVVLVGCKDNPTPEECKDVDFLFDSEPCMDALTERCRSFTTQAECWGAEPVEVPVYTKYAYCAWTQVAVVTGEQPCEVVETFGRCEPALPAQLDGLFFAGCADGQFTPEGSYTAFVDDMQLVDDYVTAPDGTEYGWFSSDASRTPCSENVIVPGGSPPRPDWCSCAEAACMATGD